MAFFKFRGAHASKSEEPARSDERKSRKPADTVEGLRRSARHRLVGAAVLVIAAVVGFPLLFETEPRPLPVNAPVTIPHRDQVAPLAPPQPRKGDVAAGGSLASNEELVPVAPRGDAPGAPTAVASDAAPAADASAAPSNGTPAGKAPAQAGGAPGANAPAPAAAETANASGKRDLKAPEEASRSAAESKAAAADQARQAQKAKEAQAAKEARKADEARALAALQGRSVPDKPAAAADDKGSFIIQIGAFSDVQRASDLRQKALQLGLKSYTQALKTKDGGLTTRVRVGPFSSRAEAERAAGTLKRAGLSGQILPS